MNQIPLVAAAAVYVYFSSDAPLPLVAAFPCTDAPFNSLCIFTHFAALPDGNDNGAAFRDGRRPGKRGGDGGDGGGGGGRGLPLAHGGLRRRTRLHGQRRAGRLPNCYSQDARMLQAG